MRKLKIRLDDVFEQHNEKLPDDAKLTQRQLAIELNIPESTLSRYMKGYLSRYDAEILEKLCNYFDVEIGQLLYMAKQR